MDLQNNSATKVAALDERGVTLERDGKQTKFIPWGEDAEARAAAAAAQKSADDAATEAATAQETAEDAQNAADAAERKATAAQTAAGAAEAKANEAKATADAANSKFADYVTTARFDAGQDEQDANIRRAQNAADWASARSEAAETTANKCVKKEVPGSDRLQTAGRALQHQDGKMWMIGESSSGTPLLNFAVGEQPETIAQIFTRTSSTLDAARIRLDRVQRTTSASGTTTNRMSQRIGIEVPNSGSGMVPSHRGRFDYGGTQLTPQFAYSIWTIEMDYDTTFFVGVYKGTVSNQDYYLLGANAFKRSSGTLDGEGTVLAMRTLV